MHRAESPFPLIGYTTQLGTGNYVVATRYRLEAQRPHPLVPWKRYLPSHGPKKMRAIGEHTPKRRPTSPQARHGLSRSLLSKTVDARKVGAKQREEVASKQCSARDAAIHAVRKAANPHLPATEQAAEANKKTESLRLKVELHRLFRHAVHPP